MTDCFVSVTREACIATVTLERTDKLNALTPAMLERLEQIARELEADNETRVVILTGGGAKAFCVGADINEWAALEPLDMWRRWVRRGHQVFDQWARLRQPVIAAVNGHAFGGGLELAITADVRIAATEARFALPEASIATCPGWSGTQRLVRLIGGSRAKYLALSGMRVNAADAHACGLIHEVVPRAQLTARAHELALEIAARAPLALQLTKQLVNAASGEESAATLEAMAGALAATTHDAAEGIRSFREKRSPVYEGR
ncbi:enoyl-CoA hydratase/isomerase family protein [Caballeronia sp. LZ035]|uniref:enoyl-CoA hydratase/isomerase family protein n=1 Tax=Caballeronia sp. LZ035 TaxID=3038568 RepID=UPI00285F128F|nr:enoyl-CoA hydratase/isomerase family protein [Caballeronia sp. LZ035]MDR5758570.1 enoyl-CoA hydratase/isomerase family protein [Caballeronia sp. LZ035]